MSDLKTYDESAFRVLKGLEPVRERPGMYTRIDHCGHVIQEVIDNAADEALAGFATQIKVRIHADESISVFDNGRGIPIGLHPEEKVPVVVLAFTRLHAGGKFNKGEGAYAFAGGLHGVGVAVTTALAHKVEVVIGRDGKKHRVLFEDGGERIGAIEIVGDAARTGTQVRVWPNMKYFNSPNIPVAELERLLKSKAVLLPGVKITFINEIAKTEKTWHYEGGMAQYFAEAHADKELVAPIFAGEKYAKGEDGSSYAAGEGASWAVAWVAEGGAGSESFVNLIPTPAGGMHEAGLRAGVFEAVKNFVTLHGLLPRGVKLQQEDVCSKMGFVLSAKVLDPQFQGQTKERLNTRSAYGLVSQMVRDPFELWLNAHVDAGKAIADLAIRQASARQRMAQKVEKKKTSSVTMLPGKLADCESEDIGENELFLVEGDSAGGSAKQARNRETQAILCLRGKVLNAWEVEPDRLFANNEIHDIAVALGVDPHGKDSDAATVLENLRYGKVVVMCDADVDGAHIQTLLLTLFLRHFPKLLEGGHIYIAQPPLYRVDVPAQGKKRPARRLYALDDEELAEIRDRLQRESVKGDSLDVGRFKGLGEMNPDQLAETTMNPATRRLVEFRVTPEEYALLDGTFDLLMAKGASGDRREWMEIEGNTVEVDA